jgi:hypothetical protein
VFLHRLESEVSDWLPGIASLINRQLPSLLDDANPGIWERRMSSEFSSNLLLISESFARIRALSTLQPS